MSYYYIEDHEGRAYSFRSIKQAKSQAIAYNSLIYFNKKQLPKSVTEVVGGACKRSRRCSSGEFTQSINANKFNKES